VKNIVLLFILSVVLIVNGNAQTASAKWALTADTAVVVIGHVVAPGQVLSKTPISTETMVVSEFLNATDMTGRTVSAELLWLNGTGWPQEFTQNDGRYIEFSISPLKGNNLSIKSIAMEIGCVGSNSHFFANVCYSLDSLFKTSTKLTATPLTLPDLRTKAFLELLYTPIVVVSDSQKFYVRIYPWFDSTSKNPATKYICLSNLVISGNTAAQINMTKMK
jgi:hypothetical protein